MTKTPCSDSADTSDRITVPGLALFLKRHGVSSSRVNAECLLSNFLQCRIIDLYTYSIKLSREQRSDLDKILTRRISGEPLQYITGRVNFCGNELIVRKGVFIPRPETEVLAQVLIEYAQKLNTHVWDMCTGSGNIAISLTKASTHCKIISSDISAKALDTARENALLNNVADRIIFIKADLVSIPDKYKGYFDIISCNPPYIRACDIEHLGAEISHEPPAALNGGADGLDFYRIIIKHAPFFLKKNGCLVFEIPDNSSRIVEEMINHCGCFDNIGFFKDLNNIERVIAARYKG